MQTLNPHTIPLKSINLIEASAGTGKSWTVTLLYLRLILEKGLTVDQILVVTFTDAATKELRDAVRNRLVDALNYFENTESDTLPEYETLYQSVVIDETTLEASINRLKRAKLSIDEAAIFTIHGFCQRALTEYAFEASLPFESELMDDDKELMQKLTDDYWRRNFYKAPKTLIYKLQQKSITPDSLLEDIWKHVGKPYLEIIGPETAEIKEQQWLELEGLFETAKTTWQADASAITQQLVEHGGLNKRSYSETQIINLCQAMGEGISSLSRFIEMSEGLDKLGELKLTKGTNKGFEPPTHSFFSQWQTFLDYWENINSRTEDFINRIRIDLLKHLQRELPKEKKRLGVLAFDDLLLQLQAALKASPALAEDLKTKYKAALIDEFQDTDPIQYDIFSTIYHDLSDDNVVFLVGDPKQAIYSFRGGDIHTYLKAKNSTLADNRFTLATNFRSHPRLINAYNALYARSDNPFQDADIKYEEVNSGKKLADLVLKNERKPLQFWSLDQEKGENADAIKTRIASVVAGDIATLLNDKIFIEDREVSGGDFAILVRSHRQGDIIKQALGERGIASIQSSTKTIFETHEAEDMRCLLSAIVEPQREDGVRRAFVTELMGKTAEDLLAFEADAHLWEEQLVRFQSWHYQWKNQGFLPMMRNMMRESNVYQHLLSYPDGERRLTNILHLSELIHRATRQRSLSMEEVLRWLKKQQESSRDKEGELRLESDENLVKIVTIHKSKGLEYPIVYCPFVGLSGKAFSDKSYSFHKNGNAFLEMGSEEADEHKALKQEEEKAEETRLLYVALTRAKYQCNVVCFPHGVTRNGDTALSWLLTNGLSIKGTAKEKKFFHETYQQNLSDLVNQCDVIGLDDLPEYKDSIRYQTHQNAQTLRAREFTAEIKSQAQVTSFSGLTAGSHSSEYEVPDHDAQVAPADLLIQTQENDFPRGATAGTALHEIFEHLDFKIPIDEQQTIIADSLGKWGFDQKHIPAANSLMEESLQAEIFSGFSLNQLSKDKRLDEMEFYLPLDRLDVDALQQVLYQYLPEDWVAVRNSVTTLNFEEVEGFLKGYIDLIFEHQGQYFIVDYKSNSLADYAPDNLLPVMADSHYYLQYLLYSVALHRYLKKRITDYSWETHIGGAYYLFIRGMNASADKKAENRGGVLLDNRSGVFYNKPSIELITALDGLFMESFL